MSFINVRQLSELVNSSMVEIGYESTAEKFLKKYNMKLQHEDLQNLLETASRVNKRERTKEGRSKPGQKGQSYEIFVFGQLKIFNWALVLYSHVHSLDLAQYTQADMLKIQSIFKKKSKLFIEYQIRDILEGRNKKGNQWQEEQINLLKTIMKDKKDQSEWKAVSYTLFQRSEGKYFKSFAICREKWISHINPNIKKTDWSMEEDVELFVMIKNYGCRWALISRQLKGIRSEHSVKNRYNVLVKNVKKQFRVGDIAQLNQKVLKYLKMKLDRQKESEIQMNLSGYSFDSKCSRERSREEQKLKLNLSRDSSESNDLLVEDNVPFSVFNEIYQLSPEVSNSYGGIPRTNNIQQVALKGSYMELKPEKKTNDDDEEEGPQSLRPCIIDIKGQGKSDLRLSTIEELDREYNRLLNFSEESSGCMLANAFENCHIDRQEEDWFDNEDKGMCWFDLA